MMKCLQSLIRIQDPCSRFLVHTSTQVSTTRPAGITTMNLLYYTCNNMNSAHLGIASWIDEIKPMIAMRTMHIENESHVITGIFHVMLLSIFSHRLVMIFIITHLQTKSVFNQRSPIFHYKFSLCFIFIFISTLSSPWIVRYLSEPANVCFSLMLRPKRRITNVLNT